MFYYQLKKWKMYIERMNQIKNFKVKSTENKLMIQTETRFEIWLVVKTQLKRITIKYIDLGVQFRVLLKMMSKKRDCIYNRGIQATPNNLYHLNWLELTKAL